MADADPGGRATVRFSVIRPVELADVEEITELRRRNREFLAPWEPTRPDDYFTEQHQRDALERDLQELAFGRLAPFVIADPGGSIVGMLNLNGITRGALQSAAVGYWVSQHANGRGLATAAVREAMRHAFETLGLHRLQAETLLHNVASQRVLRSAGFAPYGLAPLYLKIAGQWQDHVLFHAFTTVPEDDSADRAN